MKYIVFFVLFNVAQSDETQILSSKISPSNPLNITRIQHSISINDCQQPSFANHTIGKKRFISVDDDTFKEYLKTVDLTVFDGLPEYDHFKNWTPPGNSINDVPTYLSGYDPENRPIIVTELGKYQGANYALGGREMQALAVKFVHYLVYQFLKAMAFKSTSENPVHQFIQISDLEGLKPETVLNLRVLKLFVKVDNLLRHFFYKYRYKVVILNSNPIAEIGLNALRTSTQHRRDCDWDKRNAIFGNDRAFWVPKLVQMFGRNQLSEKFGGCKGFLPTYVV